VKIGGRGLADKGEKQEPMQKKKQSQIPAGLEGEGSMEEAVEVWLFQHAYCTLLLAVCC